MARIEAFGALVYPISPYFEFIFRLDRIFTGGLSEKSLMLNGSHVVRTIESELLKNECLLELFKCFFPDNSKISFINKLFYFILHIFSRMRGKDFSFSLVRKHASLKRTTRDRIAVISDPTCRMRPSKTKKYKKSNNEENDKNQDNDDNDEEDTQEQDISQDLDEIEQDLNAIVDSRLEPMEEQELENDE